ncbi:MAG TPA: glycosyltransferase family 1 protein [Rubricoccaceae bacterium]|nr:glycosyltransferase family 1 protein [Rubricoccaceae bacterium]
MPVAMDFVRRASRHGVIPSGDGFAGDGCGRRLRIALFTGNYVHIRDGVSLTLNRLVRYLEAHGHEVLVFAPTVDDPALEPAGTLLPVPSVPAPGRPEYRLSVAFPKKARARLEAFDPDLVHVATPDYLGVRAVRWAQKRGVPAVASFHTHFASYLKYYHLGAIEPTLWAYGRWFYRHCAQVYVPSEAMAEVLRENGITTPTRLWSRGIEAGRFAPAKRSAVWRAGHGFRAPVVAFVSRLVWEKGLETFAEVVERLEREGVPHHSLIVGDGPAREALERRLTATVFTGHLEGEALATAYASSDVFLFPSETETFGNVTLEAMASGLPTVAADASGSRGLVRDGVTGFLCPPGDDAAFYDAVVGLVRNDRQRVRLGAAARREALTYDWGAIMDRLVGYYDEVLCGPHAPEVELAVSPQAVLA